MGEPYDLPDVPISDPAILECLDNPVVIPSRIRTAEERLANPSELTLSFREVQEQLKRAGLVS